MDVLIALVVLTAGIATLFVLFFASWIGGFVLLLYPRWVGEKIVHRFWPECAITDATLRRYRMAGCFSLVLAVGVTTPVILELLGR